ncbi:carbohydrate-binding domain-containing protein [Methylibium rhizosphaerae]|uniref:carbohydrate-binding domain-containing protein n=1 Tax=Methylibium rhizosphaerae TaxID=2570323 RepID=UPI00112DD246|nr:carbohydrate-binding domain-containing protein [Methylibium rhizosphaerae]
MPFTKPEKIELVIKEFGIGADLYAGYVNQQNATSPTGSVQDQIDASINFLKVVEAVASLVREIPVLGTVLNGGSLTSNLIKANEQRGRGGSIEPSVVFGLVSDLAAFASTAAFATAVAGTAAVSAPVLITLAGGLAAVGMAASIYGTVVGVRERTVENDLIVRWSTRILDEMSAYGNYAWSLKDDENFRNEYQGNPVLGPALQLIHAIDTSLSLDRAVSILQQSDTGSSFQGGRLREASTLLRSVGRILLNQDVGSASSLETYATQLSQVWPAIRERAGQLRLEATHYPDIARNDFAAFLSLSSGAPFALRFRDNAEGTAAPQALQALHEQTYQQWLADKNAVAAGADPSTLNFSDGYLNDRAAMLNTNIAANTRDVAYDIGGRQITGVSVSAPIQYEDRASGMTYTVSARGASPQSPGIQRVVFGTAGNDASLEGRAGDDRIYAGSGVDTLNGREGNDYLEGGAGYDAYHFDGSFGHDTVVDADSTGNLWFDGQALTGTMKKVANDVWEDEAGRFVLIWQPNAQTGRGDLIIGRREPPRSGTVVGTVTVRNFGDGELGLTLSQQPPAQPALTQYTGDIIKHIDPDRPTHYQVASGGYASDGVQADAADVINASEQGDLVRGGGGNDGLAGLGGDDRIEGGAGNDLLLGGLGADTLEGGAGNDFIFGSALGSVDRPEEVDFTPPTSSGTELARGFSWVVYDAPGEEADGRNVLTTAGAHTGAWWRDGTELLAESDGNVISGGDGDDRVFAGTANDLAHGDAGSDTISGMGGADWLFGDAGDDFVWGDGNLSPAHYTPVEHHGADVISGGAGRDQLVGQGGDDQLYGGTEDDAIYGDDETPDTPLQYHGMDWLEGNEGDDTLVGGGRDDTLWGDSGNDRLLGDGDASKVPVEFHGADFLDGGSGNDELSGGGGDDTLMGGADNDLLWGDAEQAKVPVSAHGQDVLDGEAGDDELVGCGGDDQLYGGTGNDVLLGDGAVEHVALSAHGDDYLDGAEGNDELAGNGGADVLLGGVGNDILLGDGLNSIDEGSNDGNDSLDGGEGDDALAGNGGNDTLLGGAGDDQLQGGSGDDRLDGGAGFDAVFGGAGNDTLVSDGDDYLDGGEGDDLYLVQPQAPTVVNGVMTVPVPVINDAQGVNTIQFAGSSTGTSGAQVFVQNGTVYAALDSASVVAVGSQASLAALSLDAGNGDQRSLQSIVDAAGTDGAVRSGFWTAEGGMTWTDTVSTAQSLLGSAGRDYLAGGTGADVLDGGAGDDRVNGGAGADELVGGAGSDVIIGGVGNDTLNANLARSHNGPPLYELSSGDDGAADVYLLSRGDGEDWITAQPGSGGALDVVRFGEGISASDLQITNLRAGTSLRGVHLAIQYGDGDRLVLDPGAEGTIRELQFADGSVLSMSDLVASQFVQEPDDDGIIHGTEASDALSGTDADDHIEGHGGDDTIDGGAGTDHLVGGTGFNTYRFGSNGGSDLIDPTAGERGLLAFESAVRVHVEGDDLLLSSGAASLVRLRGYASDPSIAANWQIRIEGSQAQGLGAYVAQHGPSSPDSELAPRRQHFVDAQLWQLRTQVQRYDRQDRGSVPVQVQQASFQLGGGAFEHSDYLATGASERTVTTTTTRPIYEWIETLNSSGPLGRFVSVEDLPVRNGVIELPPNSTEFYSEPVWSTGGGDSVPQQRLLGVFLPPDSNASLRTQPRVVGYETTTYTYTVSVPADSATQMLVSGSDNDDVIVPGQSPDSSRLSLFRGVIDTGTGNDRVELLSVDAGYWGMQATRRDDWSALPAGVPHWYTVSNHHSRGSGAWLDLGAGDDLASGTDADDFIVGGAGNDWLDGQAGADTYYIGANGTDMDRISDIASFDPAADQSYLAYGGRLDQPNLDVVVFDDSVSLHNLSYRWGAVDPETGLQALELWTAGRLFLQIDYSPATAQGRVAPQLDAQTLESAAMVSRLSTSSVLAREVSMPGVERFAFADGTVLSVQQLLSTIPVAGDIDSPLELSGTMGRDLLSGGSAADVLIGRQGDDHYVIDGTADRVVELEGEGSDSVSASVDYTLTGHVENLTLTAQALLGTGNAQDNGIFGNALGNTLDGAAGADRLSGNEGTDHLLGGADSDVLYGGEGADLLQGDTTMTPVVVRARAQLVDGVGARMQLWLDGELVGEAQVDSTMYTDYRFDVAAELGRAARLDVVFTNDHYANGQDRNLWVSLVTVGEHAMRTTDAGVVIDRGAGAQAFDGLNTIAGQNGLLWNGALRFTVPASAFGTAGDDELRGDNGDDVLLGGAGNDLYIGGAGADRLIDSAATSNDVYAWGRGSGADTLVDAGGDDRLEISGVEPEELWFRQVGDDLEISIIGSTDRFTIEDWYADAVRQVETIQLSYSGTLLNTQVQALVDAMAGFVPPAEGETTLPASYQATLQPVIAANWH